jgi:hypothetical protein
MSSQIYELFGFLLDDDSPSVLESRKRCICPFTGAICDGGGNRYQSFLHLEKRKNKELVLFFNGKTKDIPAGVCSLITKGDVWIVCPRRLFVLDKGGDGTEHEKFSESILRNYFPKSNLRIGVWSEVKIKYSEHGEDDSDKIFDYTFDYIACPTVKKLLADVSKGMGLSEQQTESLLLKNGYTLAKRAGQKYVDDYPDGSPLIIEVMTSSTSGGNKTKGTTVQNSFKLAILVQPHEAPGINYRQVWARMVSQLIVKSQIGKAWGGRTIWALQDSLVKYISNTTDLNFKKLISKVLQEVNILSIKYSSSRDSQTRLVPLEIDNLYAGPIPQIHGDTDFNKLLQAASIPSFKLLQNKLLSKRPRTFIDID